MSLRTKLIALILIFVIPTVGLTVVFYTRIIEQYRAQSNNYQTSSLNMLGGMLKFLQFDARSSLESIGASDNLLPGDPACGQYLDRLIQDEGTFEHLFLVDKNGNVTCSDSGFLTLRKDIPATTFLSLARSDNFTVDEIAPYPDGLNILQLNAVPVRDQNNEISGTIAGIVSNAKISSVMSRAQLPKNSDVLLSNSDGKIIYSQTKLEIEVFSQVMEQFKKLPEEQRLTRQKISIFSNNRPIEFWTIPQGANPRYLMVVHIEEDRFIDQVKQLTSGTIAIIALMTLIILILAYTGVDITISKPLAKLTDTANQLAEGRLDVRTNLKNDKDEIGQLASILDRMAGSLEESRVTLENETSAKLASQEKFYRLFADSLLGIFQATPQGYLVEANPAMAKMFGFSSSESMMSEFTKGAASLFSYEDDIRLISEKIDDHQSVHLETRFRKQDGTFFYGDLHMWGVWNASGDLESMEGFVEDITGKKAIQSQLVKLSQAVEQNPIGIVISDGNGLIEYANNGCREIFGYEPGELIGKPLMTLVPDSAKPEELDLIRNTLKNDLPYRGETRNFKKNGEPFWERFVASPIRNNPGDEPNTLILLEDITEQYANRARITQQVEELSALRTIDLAISSNLDLQATLNIIGNLAIKHLRVDAVSIELYDPRFNMLHTAVQSGFQSVIPEDIHFPAAVDLTDWELVEEFSVHIPENLNERRSGSRLSFPRDDQFSACFGLPLVAKAEVKGLFRVYLKEPLTPEQHWLDFFYNLAAQTAIALDNFEMLRNLKQSNTDLLEAYEATIEGWSKALNYRDAETEEHSERTTRLTIELARELGYTDEDLIYIRRGALLHDIGKVAVPDNILNKPGPLTDEEWVQMRLHPVAAFEVLSPIKFLKKSLDIPYCHHERWDGTGYPRGLSGEEIPLPARMFSVIDVYDALSTDRPYRKAWPQEKVIAYLRENSGSHFDPVVVDEFLKILERQTDNPPAD